MRGSVSFSRPQRRFVLFKETTSQRGRKDRNIFQKPASHPQVELFYL